MADMAVKQGAQYEPKTSHRNILIPHKVEPAIQVDHSRQYQDGEVQVYFMACISTKTKGWKWPEKKNQLLFPIKVINALQYFRKCVFWQNEKGVLFVGVGC